MTIASVCLARDVARERPLPASVSNVYNIDVIYYDPQDKYLDSCRFGTFLDEVQVLYVIAD